MKPGIIEYLLDSIGVASEVESVLWSVWPASRHLLGAIGRDVSSTTWLYCTLDCGFDQTRSLNQQ